MSYLGGFGLTTSYQGSTSSSTLQSTISAATSGIGELPPGVIHHPLTCIGKLYYDENGVFSCEHFEVPADDIRTKAGLIHSVALLIIEMGFEYAGMDKLPYDR